MVYRATLIAAIVLVFSASLLAHKRIDDPMRPRMMPVWQCRRIVSMAPSITETLYALGLGERVVGVTWDCRYPPEVVDKTRIGGCYDPNFETILALKPDLVILSEEHEQALSAFEKLEIETLVVSHKTIEGVIDSFRTIGRVCGKGAEGRRMAYGYENRLGRIHDRTRLLTRPRVLLALNRVVGRGHLDNVCIAGADNYLNRIIELAGGENACQEAGDRYPIVSPEGIVCLNPEVIVDVTPRRSLKQSGNEALVADWSELKQLGAVRSGRVVVLDEDYAVVPGPRFIGLIEDLARAIHPEVKWDSGEENGEVGTMNEEPE
jgi:iron complex transport system substrate-binding protein